jgi:hypothetical protein
MANLPTVAQTAKALAGVRESGDELTVNLFLCAVERHYGTEHMKAAHALAGEQALETGEDELQTLAELCLNALTPSMDGEEAPHPDVAVAYNVAYRIVHGAPEPERDEAMELPF